MYSSWFCPYAQRTWAHLEELTEVGLQYQYVPIDPYASRPDGLDSKQALSIEQKAAKYPEFVRASPRGLVPAIDHGGVLVNDSTVCCEYLSEAVDRNPGFLKTDAMNENGKRQHTFVQATMMPPSAADRAKARLFWEHCSTQVIPWFYRALMYGSAEEQKSALQSMLKGIRAANDMMLKQSPSGFFFGEDQYTLADIALAPWWQRMQSVMKHYRGFEVPSTQEYARLHDWWSAVSNRPSWRRTMVDTNRLIANYREYADGSATSAVANIFVRKVPT